MSAVDREDVRAAVERLGPWFHNLHLPDGTQTRPDHFLGDFPAYKWKLLGRLLPDDLRGATVLDIGCNAGFYSIELAKRGAQVVGFDVDPHYLAQARWAAQQFGVSIEFRQGQVYDLAHDDEQFDVVLFMGVLYHLRHPLLGLDIVSKKVRKTMVFQTMTMPGGEEAPADVPEDMTLQERSRMLDPGWPKMAFIERRLERDPTNWWAPNHPAVLAMLRSVGMKVQQSPGHEIYLCEPDRTVSDAERCWDEDEYRAATRRR